MKYALLKYLLLYLLLALFSLFIAVQNQKQSAAIASNSAMRSVFSYRDYKGLNLDVGGIGNLISSIGSQSSSYFMTHVYVEASDGRVFNRYFHPDTELFFTSNWFSVEIKEKVEEYQIEKRIVLSKVQFEKAFGMNLILSVLVLSVVYLINRSHDVKMKAQLSKVRSVLAKKMAHDIRSPLTTLQLAISTIDEKREESRKLIFKSIERIRNIADSFLVESNQKMFVEGKGDAITVLPVINDVIEEKRLEFSKNSQISFFVDSVGFNSDLQTLIPKTELSRTLSNLLNNAATSAKGRQIDVRILIRRDGNNIFIEISDNGDGVREDIKEKIFEEGVSGEARSGLGLFLTRESLRRYGGEIFLKKSDSSGSVFVIVIPCVVKGPGL